MDAGHKRALEKLYGAAEWSDRSKRGTTLIQSFRFADVALRGWQLAREARKPESKAVTTMHALYTRPESGDALLRIDVMQCASVKAANEQLLEVLGNIETDALEPQTDSAGVGEIAFGLGDSMQLFRHANVVVWIRNAGRDVVAVDPVARAVDTLLKRLAAPLKGKR